ncbi:MAG: murein L,D-transpeptidase catalytic domain family protein [Bacteroidota bacterium]
MLDLEEKGLSREAFEYAYKGYQQLVEKSLVTRPDYLTICDLSQSSKHKRFYLIDIINNRIILNTYVAHGKNSGGEYARKFSNKPESRQSSLGFYVTKNIYSGEHGVSLRVEGLEPGFNDRAYGRAIVIHGADYIGDGSAGRSYGCPAVPKDESKAIINMTKTEPVYLYTILKKNICKALKFLMADWTQTTRMDDN